MEKPKNESSEQFSVSKAFNQLQRAADIMREMGLKVIDRFITKDRLVNDMPFPIVRDGANGIRATYSKQIGLKIWFTNGFENPNDPKRYEIEKRLKEAGLM